MSEEGGPHLRQFHVPVMLTARLLLRGLHPDEHAALAAIYADAGVMRYILIGTRGPDQVAADIERYAAEWALHGHGVWAVIDRQNSRLHGMCGFVEAAEIGYILGRTSWGCGIATEAADACVWYGFEHLGYDEIGAGALLANTASRHVLKKLGMWQQANDFFDSHGGIYCGIYYRLKRDDHHPLGTIAVLDPPAAP